MKNRIFSWTMLLVMITAALVIAGDTPWFDMQNCDMCKIFMTEEGLMENMTWEQHKTSDGFLSISTVTESHKEAFEKVNEAANVLGDKLMAGEEHYLCGSCTEFSKLLAKGAQMEDIKTNNGSIMIVKSTDPELVKALHAWCDKNDAEMAKMMPAATENK